MERSDIILGIESSCDDTSAAVIKDGYLLSMSLQVSRFTKIMAEWCLNLPPELTNRTLSL